MITVAIVDDHPIVRAGMRAILESAGDIVVVAEGRNAAEAIQTVGQYTPDVLVLDINLPDKSGIDVTRELRARNTPTAILILTVHDDPQMVFELLENGACGYVLKDDTLEVLPNAVRAASRGECWLSPTIASQVVRRAVSQQQQPLSIPCDPVTPETDLTPREFEILCLLAEGLDNAAIAGRLVLTKRTVQNHISNIYGKLGVTSRIEAMLYAIRQGWIQAPSGENTPDGS